MQAPQLGLDHVGLAIRDLAATSAAFAALGFTLSPRSMHAGATTPGGPIVPWGSGNQCAMFEQGYVELLGLVDETLFSNVKQMVAKYEGLHIVALDCSDADYLFSELARRGVACAQPITLERDAAYGLHNEEVRRAQFKNIYLDGAAFPEARFIVIEHKTRNVLWQPHLLAHANGAIGLDRAYLVSDDLDATNQRLTQLLGVVPSVASNGVEFPQRDGALWLMSPAQMLEACPVLDEADVRRVSAMRIVVRRLQDTIAYLNQAGVAFTPSSSDGRKTIWVAPTKTIPTAIEFAEA